MANEAKNTDVEIWREREGDAYSDSIHVTEGNGIGFNVGGTVIVMPHYEWFALATGATKISERCLNPKCPRGGKSVDVTNARTTSDR